MNGPAKTTTLEDPVCGFCKHRKSLHIAGRYEQFLFCPERIFMTEDDARRFHLTAILRESEALGLYDERG